MESDYRGRKGNFERFVEWCRANPSKPIGDRLLERLRNLIQETPGLTMKAAAGLLGVTPRTLQNRIGDFLDSLPPEETPPPARLLRVRADQVLRTLDREYSEMISRLTEKTGWFVEALIDVGWYSLMMALQYAKVGTDAEELDRKVTEFTDARAFADYVKKLLAAMINASRDAARIVELEEELMGAKLMLDFANEVARKAVSQRDQALTLLRAAAASMCESCLRRFMLAFAVSQVAYAVAEGGVAPAKAQEAEKAGEGGGEG